MQNFININMATLNKAFKVDGTATRLEFWYFILFTWLVDIFASLTDIFLPGDLTQNIMAVLLFIPTITVGIRRMHDTDHSGWFILVPFYGFYLNFKKTVPNRWSDS